MFAMALTRSAATGTATASDTAAASTASARRKNDRIVIARSSSERKDRLEDPLRPAHRLRLVDVAGAAVLEPRVGDLHRRHDIAGEDERRIDYTRQPDELGPLIDADLLFAGDDEIAVRQHIDHGDGDRAAEQVVRRGIALAFELARRCAGDGAALVRVAGRRLDLGDREFAASG